MTLWPRINKNPDVSTGPRTFPFACLLAPLTHSRAPYCSLCSRALLRPLLYSLAHSFTPELVGKWMIKWLFLLRFFLFWTIVQWPLSRGQTDEGPAGPAMNLAEVGNSARFSQMWIKVADSFFLLRGLYTGSWTKGEMHYGWKQQRIQTKVLGHSLIRSLICSLVCLLRTARSLSLLTPSLVGQWIIIGWLFCLCFFLFSTIVKWEKIWENRYFIRKQMIPNSKVKWWGSRLVRLVLWKKRTKWNEIN